MVSKYGRPLFARPVNWAAQWLHARGFTPNAATYTGFVLTAVAAVVLATGNFRVGGFLLWGAATFDMLDGALARISQQSSAFGAFLDSTLDRYSEAVTFFALAFFYSRFPGTRVELVLIFAILVGSMMVSYTKARAEGLKIEVKYGWLQRPERMFLLIFGLITGWLLPILWALAIFTNVTAIQRIYEVYWRTSALARKRFVKSKDKTPVQG
ncbi:MAG: CDP-alcohol phosphatidyltransferase family protein [Chloroflexi bacterium]|nr:MAG: CDP-alcohol phosphatidyltransferase family protein [Chloroflexota bacterium]